MSSFKPINPIEAVYGDLKKPHVPSELLEGPLTLIMGILFDQYTMAGCTDVAFKILLGQASALGMFISELHATHCSLAFTNEVRSMLWNAERDPKYKKQMDKQFRKVLKDRGIELEKANS